MGLLINSHHNNKSGGIFVYAVSLLFLLISCQHHVVLLTSAAQSACSADFVEGTCVCNLADGQGTLDLTKYVDRTKANPLAGSDPSGTWNYYFAFCNVITNNPDLNHCYNNASVCQLASWSPNFDQVVGIPKTTRFETRTTKDHTTPQLALVTDYSEKDGKWRSIAFLQCDKTADDPVFMPDEYTAEKDPEDNALLFVSTIKGSDLCTGSSSPESGLSVGSILLIVFFCSLFAYFVGGFLVLTFVSHKQGYDRIPHRAFWVDLPVMAKDGALFTYNKLRGLCGRGGSGGGGGGYEQQP